MPSKTALNLTNLEALGASRLAEIVLDMATGDANAKRRLRMELAGDDSPAKFGYAIRKRLTAISQSTRYIGWRALKSFIADLEAQRGFIRRLAAFSVSDALELGWQFMGLCNAVLERTTDPSGEIFAVFSAMAHDLSLIAGQAAPLPDSFVFDLHTAVKDNAYGQCDGLILALATTVGPDGLRALDARLAVYPPVAASDPETGRRVSRWVHGRVLETETIFRREPEEIMWAAELEIADGLGDIDRYISLQPDPNRLETAIGIAERQITGGRHDEALERLDRAAAGPKQQTREWRLARLAALEALCRVADAQAFRWRMFEVHLDADILRDYLKRLPDFDDIEAEDQAMLSVAAYPDVKAALRFLVEWPRLDEACALVLSRVDAMDQADIDFLRTAADKLAIRYPLAAVLLLRRAIESVLAARRSADYEAAGQMHADLVRMSACVADWQAWPDNVAFEERLKSRFGLVTAFWQAAA